MATKLPNKLGGDQRMECCESLIRVDTCTPLPFAPIMNREVGPDNVFVDNLGSWNFVDWAPDFDGTTAESMRATGMEYYGAFSDGAYLLRELGDESNSAYFERRAADLKKAAREHIAQASGSFGSRFQTNAAAVVFGVADPSQYSGIWQDSLGNLLERTKKGPDDITPYYAYYVMSAMAKMGHTTKALRWIRQIWGGMLAEGATSYWEGYDPTWFKDNPHVSLEADRTSRYRVSLAHGWSSDVAPWLSEEILGIKPTGGGFSNVDVCPKLGDLNWVKGAEPTPRGPLNV